MPSSPKDILGTIVILLVTVACVAGSPFLKAAMLHWTTSIMKFESKSYRKALFCVLIGIGVVMMAYVVSLALTIRMSGGYNVSAIEKSNLVAASFGLLLAPISEIAAVLFFFRVSAGKAVGAVVLHWLLFVIGAVVLVFAVYGVVAVFQLFIGLVAAHPAVQNLNKLA